MGDFQGENSQESELENTRTQQFLQLEERLILLNKGWSSRAGAGRASHFSERHRSQARLQRGSTCFSALPPGSWCNPPGQSDCPHARSAAACAGCTWAIICVWLPGQTVNSPQAQTHLLADAKHPAQNLTCTGEAFAKQVQKKTVNEELSMFLLVCPVHFVMPEK